VEAIVHINFCKAIVIVSKVQPRQARERSGCERALRVRRCFPFHLSKSTFKKRCFFWATIFAGKKEVPKFGSQQIVQNNFALVKMFFGLNQISCHRILTLRLMLYTSIIRL
jgi:hypothetical protein